jgi:hypothetical protein
MYPSILNVSTQDKIIIGRRPGFPSAAVTESAAGSMSFARLFTMLLEAIGA